jgi:hypothetical protein
MKAPSVFYQRVDNVSQETCGKKPASFFLNKLEESSSKDTFKNCPALAKEVERFSLTVLKEKDIVRRSTAARYLIELGHDLDRTLSASQIRLMARQHVEQYVKTSDMTWIIRLGALRKWAAGSEEELAAWATTGVAMRRNHAASALYSVGTTRALDLLTSKVVPSFFDYIRATPSEQGRHSFLETLLTFEKVLPQYVQQLEATVKGNCSTVAATAMGFANAKRDDMVPRWIECGLATSDSRSFAKPLEQLKSIRPAFQRTIADAVRRVDPRFEMSPDASSMVRYACETLDDQRACTTQSQYRDRLLSGCRARVFGEKPIPDPNTGPFVQSSGLLGYSKHRLRSVASLSDPCFKLYDFAGGREMLADGVVGILLELVEKNTPAFDLRQIDSLLQIAGQSAKDGDKNAARVLGAFYNQLERRIIKRPTCPDLGLFSLVQTSGVDTAIVPSFPRAKVFESVVDAYRTAPDGIEKICMEGLLTTHPQGKYYELVKNTICGKKVIGHICRAG